MDRIPLKILDGHPLWVPHLSCRHRVLHEALSCCLHHLSGMKDVVPQELLSNISPFPQGQQEEVLCLGPKVSGPLLELSWEEPHFHTCYRPKPHYRSGEGISDLPPPTLCHSCYLGSRSNVIIFNDKSTFMSVVPFSLQSGVGISFLLAIPLT